MRTQSGFTLIELMVVVAVIGIIAAIALPSYNEHVKAGRRAAALSGVADLQLQQERWRAENTTYGATSDLRMPEASSYYSFSSVPAVTAGVASYTITAVPTATDTCGTLTASNDSKPKWATPSCDR